MVDSHFIQSCLDSIGRCAALQVNDPAVEIGSAALFLRMGISQFSSQILGVLCCLAVLFLAARLLHRSRETLSGNPAAIMLLVFSIGLATPIHAYDLCCYSVGIALLATARPVVQAVLLFPALFVWRPERWFGVFHRGAAYPVDAAQQMGQGQLFATFGWLALLLGTYVMCLAGGLNASRRNSRM